MKLLLNPADLAAIEAALPTTDAPTADNGVELVADNFGALKRGQYVDLDATPFQGMDRLVIPMRFADAMEAPAPSDMALAFPYAMHSLRLPPPLDSHRWTFGVDLCSPEPRILPSRQRVAREQRRLDRQSRHRARKRRAELARRKAQGKSTRA